MILDAALAHFLARGYPAATVDGIAAEAGLAKRTVYNLFPGKEDLFRAVVQRATATAETFVAVHVDPGIGAGDVEDEIHELALAHARAVLAPRVLATRRLLIGETHRFPELAVDYFDRVPTAVMHAIAKRLERYDSLGLLRVADSERAAEHFAYLVLGATLDRALFDAAGPSSATIDSTARAGAEAFLRAYRGWAEPA
ncbi:TetR/AcrR family transcriptional regulator [Rathayibacter oskolensis]|uniref:TetR/AcrR family transcriptional regulator n=1 Tax=Rathayibacter oskolensis TaxID=1891671 RepID=UPI001AD81F78|nr:TetR/AcrR family transcriptional regulator [Rathayibacter oskolensis]